MGNSGFGDGGMVISPFTAAAGNGGRVGATQNLEDEYSKLWCVSQEKRD